MSGIAKSLDKFEEKARKNPFAYGSINALHGTLKKKYGEEHDIDTSDEGYANAKEEKEEKQVEKDAADIAAKAEEERLARSMPGEDENAKALEKKKAASRARRRGGRSSTILTSDEPLG